MPAVRTIEQTVSTALHGVTAQLITDGKALDHVISALEERESRLLAALQSEVDEYDDDELIDLYQTARERGFLGA